MNDNYESTLIDVREDTTINYTAWDKKNFMTDHEASSRTIVKAAGLFLQDIIECYMEGPVALYKGKGIEAKSFKVDDIVQFKREMRDDGHKLILYMPLWLAPTPLFEIDGNTCTYKGVPQGSWVIRGVILDENGDIKNGQ